MLVGSQGTPGTRPVTQCGKVVGDSLRSVKVWSEMLHCVPVSSTWFFQRLCHNIYVFRKNGSNICTSVQSCLC